MAALGLGDVEDFPFLDPPDRRQVRDGVNLLAELGALDERADRLTQLGRKLAQLPVDPRMARMVLEADAPRLRRRGDRDRRRAVDPGPARAPRRRARPGRPAARALRRRALGLPRLLNLWRYLREQQRALSRQPVPQAHARPSTCTTCASASGRTSPRQLAPAPPRRSACTSTASPPSRPRSTRRCSPGCSPTWGSRTPPPAASTSAPAARASPSGPARRWRGGRPHWVMVAELVETAAAVGAHGGADRAARGWSRSPSTWSSAPTPSRAGSAAAAQVVATERVTLYGLPIVTGRTVGYGGDRPGALARAVHPPRAGGGRLGRRATRSWPRTRGGSPRSRRSRSASGAATCSSTTRCCFDFFDARVPADVVSGAHFDRWWRDARRARPRAAHLPARAARRRGAATSLDRRPPDGWQQGDLTPARCPTASSPGAAHDGVTVHVPLDAARRAARRRASSGSCPALRLELVTALLRALPKELRRPLVPVPETAARGAGAPAPAHASRCSTRSPASAGVRGVRRPGDAGRRELPAHLRMTFRVEGEDGEVLAEGEDLEAAAGGGAAAPARRAHRRRPRGSSGTAWRPGTASARCPATCRGTAPAARFPALVDEGETRRRCARWRAPPRRPPRCAPARAGCCGSPSRARCASWSAACPTRRS